MFRASRLRRGWLAAPPAIRSRAGTWFEAARPGAGRGRNLRELADDLESADRVRDQRPCFVAVDGKP